MYNLFLVPIIILIAGFFMYKFPPKKINYIVGYRTRESMKNKNSWKFANQFCGKQFIKLGIILLFISLFFVLLILFKVFSLTENLSVIIIFGQLIFLLLICFKVNYILKRRDY